MRVKKITSFLILFLLAAARAGAAVVAVYHTSDDHGWYSARPALWDNDNPRRLIGGFAALSALLKRETTPYLLLDSGDLWQGTPEGILSRGQASAVLMNQLGYAAAAPGNHDYDYGEGPMRDLARTAKFPILAANIYLKLGGERPDYLKPYAVFERGGKRLAVFGLAGRHTATSTRPENVKHLDFRDEAAEAAKLVPEIKKSATDAVIALSHLGLSEEFSTKRVDISTWTFEPDETGTLRVARAAPGIDLLLGGHNHAAFLKGWRDPVSGTVFGESGYGLSYVTRALLTFDDATGRLAGVTVENIPMWIDQVGQDPEVLKTIAGYADQVEKEMGQKIGWAMTDLLFSPDMLDSGFGNLLCDLTREAAGTQVAFQNTKAIRHEILKGDVRLRDIYQAMPFDNNIVTMRLTGAQIKQVWRDNIIGGKSFMQVSGLTVEFKTGAGGALDKLVVKYKGKEIQDGQEFTVATNDYLAFGGNGGGAFAGGKDVKDTVVPVRDVLINAFKKDPVGAPGTGRIKRGR